MDLIDRLTRLESGLNPQINENESHSPVLRILCHTLQSRVFLSIAAGVLLSASLHGSAQKFQPKSIQFKGAPEYSDQELLASAGLKAGVGFTSAELNDHSKMLMDSGVFDNLTYKFDGVSLVVSLTPAAQLYPVRLENFPFAASKDLDVRLHDRFPLFHGKVPLDGGLQESVRTALEELLAAQGIKASVSAVPYNDIGVHKVTAISYAISDPPVQIGEIHLDPASPALEPKAQEILNKQSGSAYDLDGSQNQISTNLGNFYREKGYLEADVQATLQLAPAVMPEAIRIPFLVSVTPGALYRVSGVHLAPGLVVTQAEFDHQSGIHPGDLADSVHLRQNWEFLARQYHNRGYMKASISPIPSFDRAQSTVSYSVTVEPGPVYTMGTLTIQNVADDLRAQMLAAWKMPSGAVFNEGAILGFYAIGDANPALKRVFAAVNFKYNLQLNDNSHTVDVAIRLEKKN